MKRTHFIALRLILLALPLVGSSAYCKASSDSLRIVLSNGSSVTIALDDIDVITFDTTVASVGDPRQQGDLTTACFPNPAAFETTIPLEHRVSTGAHAIIRDVLGRTVVDMILGAEDIEQHKVRWDCRDARGNAVRSGTYYYSIASTVTSQIGAIDVVR